MKKKIVTLALAGAVAFSLMACSGQTATSAGSTVSASSQTASSETPESITISSYNGSKELVELEVPYDPQRSWKSPMIPSASLSWIWRPWTF